MGFCFSARGAVVAVTSQSGLAAALFTRYLLPQLI